MKSLLPLLQQLENHIPNLEKTNSNVSNSTIGWQIDHCLLVINGVIRQVEISNPTEFKSKFNFNRFLSGRKDVVETGAKVLKETVKETVDKFAEKTRMRRRNSTIVDCDDKPGPKHKI